MAEAAGAPPDGVVAVEMAAEEDAEAGTAPAPAVLGELEHDASRRMVLSRATTRSSS